MREHKVQRRKFRAQPIAIDFRMAIEDLDFSHEKTAREFQLGHRGLGGGVGRRA
jgi:hypothetical protein